MTFLEKVFSWETDRDTQRRLAKMSVTEEFLVINKAILIHRGEQVGESSTIIEWINKTFGRDIENDALVGPTLGMWITWGWFEDNILSKFVSFIAEDPEYPEEGKILNELRSIERVLNPDGSVTSNFEATKIRNHPGMTTTNYNNFQVRCFDSNDGAIEVIPSGGFPAYSYLWNNGNTSDSITNLDAVYYEVEVTDSNDCIWTGGITLNKPSALQMTSFSLTDTCEKAVGFAETNVIGGVTPYTYLWNSGQTSASVNNLTEGIYNITATDTNLCEILGSISVFNIKSPEADFNTFPKHRRYYDQLDNPFVFIDISNTYSQDILSWHWDFDYDGISLTYDANDSVVKNSYYEPGLYRVFLSVETEYHCIDTIAKKVLVDDSYIFIPSAFTPGDNDAINNNFRAFGYGIEKYKLLIYNRWGGQIFSSTNINIGWDGKIQGNKEICPNGIYTYYIEIENIYGEIFKYEGNLNLIR